MILNTDMEESEFFILYSVVNEIIAIVEAKPNEDVQEKFCRAIREHYSAEVVKVTDMNLEELEFSVAVSEDDENGWNTKFYLVPTTCY